MPTQNVNLTGEQAKFIKRRVKTGRYQNASEVVRAGLRLLEQHEREAQIKLKHLRRLIDEGLNDFDRGDFTVVTSAGLEEFIKSVSAVERRERGK